MMQVFTCDQGTEEWFAARMGIPTASQFATVMAKGEGKTRTTYLHKLAGEVLTGEPMDHVKTFHMQRGHEMEPTARALYAMMMDVDPELVGLSGRAALALLPMRWWATGACSKSRQSCLTCRLG